MKKYDLKNIPNLVAGWKHEFGTHELFEALEERPNKQAIVDALLEGKVVIFEYSRNMCGFASVPGSAFAFEVFDSSAGELQKMAASHFGNTQFCFALNLTGNRRDILFYNIGVGSNRVYSESDSLSLKHMFGDTERENLRPQLSYPEPIESFFVAPDLAMIGYGRSQFENYIYHNMVKPLPEGEEKTAVRQKAAEMCMQYRCSAVAAYAPDIIIGDNLRDALRTRARVKADFIMKADETTSFQRL